jgi:four helix bundle protein
MFKVEASKYKTDNLILDKSISFSLAIIEYCEKLQDIRKYVISNQLLRSATSIGANVREAQNAESKADFIHKFKIAAKEAEETEYWLLLLNEVGMNTIDLISDLTDIRRVLTKIISTSKKATSIAKANN